MVAALKQVESSPHPLDGVVELYITKQRKYALDKLPRWKVFVFYHVYMPFVRFCYNRLGLPVCERIDKVPCPHCKGEVKIDNGGSWVEDQGLYLSKERAAQESNRPFWSWKALPLEKPLPDETCKYGEHDYPNAGKSKQYLNRNFDVAQSGRVCDGICEVVEQMDKRLSMT